MISVAVVVGFSDRGAYGAIWSFHLIIRCRFKDGGSVSNKQNDFIATLSLKSLGSPM